MAKELVIWTAAYSPFIMGGNVNAPIATKVEVVNEPIELADGIAVHVIASPSGTIHIAEASTGALVGTSLSQVIADVNNASPLVMRQQIAEAKEEFKKARLLSAEDFWERMAKAKD